MKFAAACVLLVLLTGCAADPAPGPAAAPMPLAACDALATGKVTELPARELACFADGAPVRVHELAGPLVINFWASWCRPCREELPVLQRLADQGELPVLGVITDDRREAAASLASELGVRFPALFDPEGALRRDLGTANLPLTLLVAADGSVTRYQGPALTDETLADLIAEWDLA